jgi:ketosteroid isomerase-like protein
MKRVVIWWIGALLCGIPASHSSAATGGVEQLNQAFVKALQAGDIDGIMKLYAADAVLFPPGERAIRGLEEIRFKWNSVLVANKITQPSFKDARYVAAANVSAGWGDFFMRLEPKSGKEPVMIRGRFSAIAEKRNGAWAYVFVGIGELDEILTLRHYSKTP